MHRLLLSSSLFVSSLVVSSVLGGCAGPDSLTGSIDQSHSLAFDTVGLRLFTDQNAYELKYEKALDSGDNDVVAKVVFDAPEGGVVLDQEITLVAGEAQVERITAKNDPFPGLDEGKISFSAGGVVDGELSTGEFSALFVNGKSLQGTFSVVLSHTSF